MLLDTLCDHSWKYVLAAWGFAVNSFVPEPYLDEVFHVRQAEEYWRGNWHVWDPKITTPPGLYVVSYIAMLTCFWPIWFLPFITKMRMTNQLGAGGIHAAVQKLTALIAAEEMEHDGADKGGIQISWLPDEGERWQWDVARNIVLFPPLFFFTALFYTDVISVLMVLCCYLSFHTRQPILVVIFGLVSLTFRQNNIFWCAIYLAGLEVLRTLKRMEKRNSWKTWSDAPTLISESWNRGEYYDPSVDVAGIEDYILCATTIAIASFANLSRLLPRLVPYLILLALFGAFVLWNGSVVLGDKSNHVASLHLPQMLYIWPYFAFFSFVAMLPNITYRLHAAVQVKNPTAAVLGLLPRPLVLVAAVVASAAAVRFNTIIHPFTLADNRHYTFYVFRILRLHPYLKYAAIPVYIACAWAAITALGSSQAVAASGKPQPKASKGGSKPGVEKQSNLDKVEFPDGPGNRASFVIVWLVSSALGLVTAPLVEPRYYILPWIVWRLHVTTANPKPAASGTKTLPDRVAAAAPYLETAWALLVNHVTMYIFATWTFEWKQEPGAVQRFMW